MKKIITFLLFSTYFCSAQQATIIDSKSATIPRYANLAAIQAAITSPQVGMMVYNIGTQTNWNYNGTSWINAAGAGASQWNTSGNNIFYNAASLNNTQLIFSSNTPYTIPDSNPIGVYSTINIPNNGNIVNPDLVTISMNLNHTKSGDLKITLIAPDGSQIVLINILGDGSWNVDFVSNNTISINKIAFGPIPNINPIPAGLYIPSSGVSFTTGNISDLLNKQISGDWKLFIQDFSQYDTGSLISWSIGFGVNCITSGGRVGIGTSEPMANLSVVGPVQFLTSNQGLGKVLTSDANGFATWQSVASQWTTNGSNINYSTGNVGIGNAAPNAPLQFSNSIQNRKIVLYEGGNNDNQYYGFGINGGVLRYQVDAISASHVFYSATNSTTSNELFRIRGDGNVGVNTQTPKSKLEVNGTLATKMIKITVNAATTLNENATVWYFKVNPTVTFPLAATCENRRYVIVNASGSALPFASSFIGMDNLTKTTIPINSSIEIISDGTNWLQIK